MQRSMYAQGQPSKIYLICARRRCLSHISLSAATSGLAKGQGRAGAFRSARSAAALLPRLFWTAGPAPLPQNIKAHLCILRTSYLFMSIPALPSVKKYLIIVDVLITI